MAASLKEVVTASYSLTMPGSYAWIRQMNWTPIGFSTSQLVSKVPQASFSIFKEVHELHISKSLVTLELYERELSTGSKRVNSYLPNRSARSDLFSVAPFPVFHLEVPTCKSNDGYPFMIALPPVGQIFMHVCVLPSWMNVLPSMVHGLVHGVSKQTDSTYFFVESRSLVHKK